MWLGCSSDCRFVKQNSLCSATGQGQAAKAKKTIMLTSAPDWSCFFWIICGLIMSDASVLSSARHLLVIQPLVGIGDMIWHKPWIDQLARTHQVTLMTKPTVQADVVFEGAPASFAGVKLERSIRGRRGRHDGLVGFFRLVSDMRAIGADAVIVLHASSRYALAARMAGIKVRLGYGIGRQRRHLNAGRYLDTDLLNKHAIDRVSRFADLNGFGLKDPVWRVHPRAHAQKEAERLLGSWAVLAKRKAFTPFLCIGIGSMNPERQWGATKFAELISLLAEQRPDLSCLILGGPSEQSLADEILSLLHARQLAPPVFLGKLDEAVALMALSCGYVGNDTSLLNFMVCVDRPALGLFSQSKPLTYSPLLHKTDAVGEDEFGKPGIIHKIQPADVLDNINSLWR